MFIGQLCSPGDPRVEEPRTGKTNASSCDLGVETAECEVLERGKQGGDENKGSSVGKETLAYRWNA